MRTLIPEKIIAFWQQRREGTIFALLFCLCLFVYGPGLNAGFQFDDFTRIVSNSFIKHLNLEIIWKSDPSRFITNLSFALNYFFGRLHVVIWHLVNYAIHALNAFLVYRLTRLIFQTPRMQDTPLQQHSFLFAMAVSLIFLLHPVQSQAVIYIVQRSTLLYAGFYLATVYFYLRARLSDKTSFYVLAVLCSLVGIFTKPSFMTLPLTIVLCEVCFWGMDDKMDRKRLLAFIVLLHPLLLIPLMTLVASGWEEAAAGLQKISLAGHALTQLAVIPTYLRLLVWPTNLNLDYDFPPALAMTDSRVWVAIAILLILLICAFKTNRWMSFCVGWFFVTLGAYTAFFPLPDLIFEHWLYLSCYGFAVMATGVLFGLLQRPLRFLPALGLLLAVFAVLSFQRSLVWADDMRFLKDVVSKSPAKARPHNNLGLLYMNREMAGEAAEEFKTAIRLSQDYYEAYNNLGILYLQQGKVVQAKEVLEKLVRMAPQFPAVYINLGNVASELGQKEEALRYFQRARRHATFMAATYIGLGNLYEREGQLVRARKEFETALWLDPDNATVHYNLGNVNFSLGRFYDALIHYQQALRIQPRFLEAMNNAAHIYYYFYDFKRAIATYEKIIEVDPAFAEAYFNLANAYYARGQRAEAREAITQAQALYTKEGRDDMVKQIQQKLDEMEP